MDKRRILLLCTQPLLGEGLASILKEVDDVELVGPYAINTKTLSHLSSNKMPDIVLIAKQESEYKDEATLTVQILEQYPGLPVIHVGLSQNVIHVYTSYTLPAHSADLIKTIHSLSIRQQGDSVDDNTKVNNGD